MPTARILLVLANPAYAEELEHHLETLGHDVEWVSSDEQGVNGLIAGSFDALVANLAASRIDGMRLLSVSQDRDPTMPVVLLTKSVPSDEAMAALDAGATAVPGEPHAVELIARHIDQGLHSRALQHEIIQLKRQLDTGHALSNLVGSSQQVATLHDQVRQLAPSTMPIILSGEPGTGRDHLARIIHTQSPRTHRSFVKVSFGPDTQSNLERLLFGFGPQAYPDAPQGSAGYIEAADSGTLYLDDLSGLNAMQSDQLLSSLEQGQVQRLGEARSIPVDVRLIVAVTPPLEGDDATVRLLDQLGQRLGAQTLELPPLRDRLGDIPALVRHFIEVHAASREIDVPAVEADALDALTRYPWPGNLRELDTVIEGILAHVPSGEPVQHLHLPETLRHHIDVEPESVHVPVGTPMHNVERLMIESTLRANDQNKEATAAQLGIGLRTLFRKLKEYKSDM